MNFYYERGGKRKKERRQDKMGERGEETGKGKKNSPARRRPPQDF
jgi:hypothetical protein